LKHKFAVNQIVELAPNSLLAAAAGAYVIRQLMPVADVSSESPRYRIKNIAESHERVAHENELTLSTSQSSTAFPPD
jgi:hypothetical protein